jgi:NTP pyrophosphatase (non-canonical NTP hydrolase)
MDFSTYQKLARRTQNKELTPKETLQHALCGLSSEAGEVCGIFQKKLQGKAISLADLKLEIGDVLWMLSELCDVYGFSLDDVAEKNIAKLKKRYPEGFDAERSNRRYE